MDDLMVSYENFSKFNTFYENISKELKIKDLGELNQFCGTHFMKTKYGYTMNQHPFIQDILSKFHSICDDSKEHKLSVPLIEDDRETNNELLNEKELKTYQEIL